MAIHPTAVVDPSAKVGDVEIGPFAVVGAEVTLHDGVILDAHSVVYGPSSIGTGTRLHAFACLGGDPQDLKYQGERSELIVGEHNVFRENVTVSRGTAGGGGRTVIGDRNLFMANSHVAHDCQIGDGCVFANSAAVAGHVVVEDGAVLGGMAGVHQFCRIGRRSMLAGGGKAAQDVPPFMLASGDRARLYGLNIVGLRRAGFSRDTIGALRASWRDLFARSVPLRIARESVMADWGHVPEVVELLEFLEGSQRGICRIVGSPDMPTE